jgi:hypothetical protein
MERLKNILDQRASPYSELVAKSTIDEKTKYVAHCHCTSSGTAGITKPCIP